MTSAFHRPRNTPPDVEPVQRRRIVSRLHPALTEVLNALDGTPIGREFRERAVQVSTSKALSEPVDHAAALIAHRWLLERAGGGGIPLTAAGYLKPADVKALAAVMPTMDDWIFGISRETDAHPVLHLREHMKAAGFLRKYKGALLLTKAGRDARADADVLWRHLADALVSTRTRFDADASVILLVHAATSDGGLKVSSVAKTLTALGWRFDDGDPVGERDVYPVWNALWTALGNVGERIDGGGSRRTLSTAARLLVNEALFEEVEPT